MGRRLFTPRRLIAVAACAAASISAYAFAASNTVPPTKAGDGAAAITGFSISNVHYVLGAADPTQIVEATFTLTPPPSPAGTIRIKLVAAGSTWYQCTAAGASVTCTTTGATALAADELRVVVVD
jgi:hypothetical protein